MNFTSVASRCQGAFSQGAARTRVCQDIPINKVNETAYSKPYLQNKNPDFVSGFKDVLWVLGFEGCLEFHGSNSTKRPRNNTTSLGAFSKFMEFFST